jgi:hypothetical protein
VDRSKAFRIVGALTLIVAIAAFVVAIAVVLSVAGRHQWKESTDQFSARHQEATSGIVHVYQFFIANGKWPSNSTVASSPSRWFPTGWEYAGDPQQGRATVWLHGPDHMILSYQFAPPQRGAVSKAWTLSIEGDKIHFTSAVTYPVSVANSRK